MRDFERNPAGGVGEPDPADLARLVAAGQKLVHAQFRTLRDLGIARPEPDLAAGVLLRQLDQVETHLDRLRHTLGASDADPGNPPAAARPGR
ncbi:hypothetical protein [Couchioplanes caeruleus]|uniref:Uncharacterized protein n=2 Tax=Couchioplanes caeruleus TaxID=56438 RepID=A0A1K0GL07_9ACTN|nr:hypothetical protein [Couchioplanes caeruleus]OJF12974.1 hypothetical protein BG844_17815 [Couchioplanes caeruleus subsp. caeruleus]ROP32001.1 hypothetical protein EDD30_4929 [Couchioplanes caeruleus]